MIKKEGGKWCLYTKDGSKNLGCHDTEEKAVAQEAAIEAKKSNEGSGGNFSEPGSKELIEKKKTRTKDFLDKLKELLAGKIKDDDLKLAINKARSHANTTSRARNKATKKEEDALAKKEEEKKEKEGKKKIAAYEDYNPRLEKSHDSVNYDAASKIGMTCGDCKYFYRYTSYDGTCQLVEGSISDIQTCNLWEAIVPTVTTTSELVEWRLFNEFGFAEAPEWIPFLPHPGKYTSPKYGEVIISQERNNNFINNFNNAVYQEKIAIDAEHESKLSGAFGWIVEMKENEDGSVDAKVDWTEMGVKALDDNRFKYFSPEFYDSWENPITGEVHKDVAVGGALTTRPFFKEGALRPLVASEQGIMIPEERSDTTFITLKELRGGEENMSKEDVTLRDKLLKVLSIKATTESDPKKEAELKAAELKEEELKTAELKKATELKKAEELKKAAGSDKFAVQLTEEVKKLREEADKSKGLINSLTESNMKLEKDNRRKRFTEIVGSNDDSKLDFMEALASKFGEDSEEFKHYLTETRANKEQKRVSALFNENGTTEIPVGDSHEHAFDLLAKKFHEEDKKLNKEASYKDAYERAMNENPQLYQHYVDEATQSV